MLYVAETAVMTSAGTSAAVDLSLQVLREVDGPEVANAVARRMVVPPHRDGGQAQYVERPLPADGEHDLADLLAWMAAHLEDELTVAGWPGARTCPSGRSPAGSGPRPAPPRTTG